MQDPIISIEGLHKVYDSGFTALADVDLEIQRGEIFALLGPNGAGKTTLISAICGLVRQTSGKIAVDGHDTLEDFRKARGMIGLVPQEVSLEPFEKVLNTIRFSRGLFGKPADESHLESILRELSLWDKRDSRTSQLSGGMQRRVLIAKALAHEPEILFLDEPTAGVDVELRKAMWDTVNRLRERGVTIILTTHYIEEAEAMADRIGIISKGRILLVENKKDLMARLGGKQMTIELVEPVDTIPDNLAPFGLGRSEDGHELIYDYDTTADRSGIASLLSAISSEGLKVKDVHTRQSSLEDIFVGLLHEDGAS
ncbi:multidrug ABC transporter ATP-binding protein [Notoacmeibacter marinus]|uniref:Multidrug ABC transporter ATP-binding protein n=1 Tax=Notoacmeibacter marinus TaxID=1876515 RepID=A0A231UUF4_9HYPH|nr:ABC transporter ATP-binding protein [Notoacmeibacter marinus]OXS99491.1 multidrug ABC transporter ATP-binding protein [Notoacmeibacter marinus]